MHEKLETKIWNWLRYNSDTHPDELPGLEWDSVESLKKSIQEEGISLEGFPKDDSVCDKSLALRYEERLEEIKALKKRAAKAEKLEARVKELEQKLSSTEDMLEIVQHYADQYIENEHLQEMYDELNATPEAN